jgi:hypothetical protein
MNNRGNAVSEGQSPDNLRLSSADLSETSIRRQLRSEAFQHPATLVPLGLAGLAAIFLLGISPLEIPAFWAIILLITSLIATAGSFFRIYSIRHGVEYTKIVQGILALHEQESREAGQAELKQMMDTLQAEFSVINSEVGLTALTDLHYEYEQLQLVLSQRNERASMSISHIPDLVEETYREGLNVLANGLQLLRAIHPLNKGRLEEEVVEIEKELENLRKNEGQKSRIKLREEMVASHRERLEMINQQHYRAEELLYQCDRCEASLSRTRFELASLQAGSSETSVSVVTESLRRTIYQAKEVQEELKKLGF